MEKPRVTPEHLIENPKILRASELPKVPLEYMAEIYSQTWADAGISIDPENALAKIRRFNPKNIFLLMDAQREKIYAELFTVLISANSLEDLTQRFSTYKSVEKKAESSYFSYMPDFLVCFSLNCLDGYRVVDGGQELSLARTILTKIPLPVRVRKMGYSFMPNVPSNGELPNHYLNNLKDTRKLGPVGMHEALGGISIAFLKDSRPEHLSAGRGNALVVYPINETEEKLFKIAKETRLTKGIQTPAIIQGSAAYFEDTFDYCNHILSRN